MTEWTMTTSTSRVSALASTRSGYPKDGLFLFGPPASNQNPARMDVGVMGTAEGLRRYETWVKSLSGTIPAPETGREENKTMWPGFQAVFGIHCQSSRLPRSPSMATSSAVEFAPTIVMQASSRPSMFTATRCENICANRRAGRSSGSL